MISPGVFIVLDGPEGAGKSTQLRLLAGWLEGLGHEAVLTREPGGCRSAERIRSVLIDGAADALASETEVLLFTAARVEHLRCTIRPALAAGKVILCDRFLSSTLAYQAVGGGIDEALIMEMHNAFCGGLLPDATLILDLPAEIGLARAQARGDANRFEAKGLDYHTRVNQAYRTLAESRLPGARAIDAGGTVDAVQQRLRDAIAPLLPERKEA